MTFYLKANNATSRVADVGGIDGSTDPVTFNVTTGEGSKFPASNFLISIDNEILLCSSRTGDALTCSRNEEGTTIATHSQNSTVEHRITKGTLEQYESIFKETSETSEADKVLLKEITPATDPTSGYRALYFKSDGKLYKRDSDGNEVEVGGSESSGWIPYSAVTPTRASADDPTYVLTFAGVDLTSTLSLGMKVKLTQNSATVYGIITKIAFSTDTTLTLYCGTDYDVLDTATYAISNFNYSSQRAPFGFPLDPTKWTQVSSLSGASRLQANPSSGVWYNLGGSLDIPIGVWNVNYECSGFSRENGSNTTAEMWVTLSTANNSQSDVDWSSSIFTRVGASDIVIGHNFYKMSDTPMVLTAKTTYYLNTKVSQANVDSLGLTDINTNTTKAIIKAVCAYL